jgi:putative flavoprotein involved in K+ transport
MRTETIETVIIGAGQAGLATGYHLLRAGRPFVILDGESRVGDGWRHQWDTLRLFTPAWADSLPGLPQPGARWSYPTKDEFADYLESYAMHFGLPVRLASRVMSVGAFGDGYVVVTGDTRIECDNVVVCTGTFGRTPRVPDFADRLDPAIRQLHSSEYRRPSQLADGTVLVVGASHSGCDIAYEAAATHPTVMVGPDTGQIPVPFASPMLRVVFPVMLFAFTQVLTRSNPLGRKARENFRHGGPRLRVQLRDLAERGVEWVPGRVAEVVDGRPVLDDGRTIDARTVVWCTGFRQVFDWVHVPAFDEEGWPREYRGVVDDVPGLYFCGIQFQYAAASMIIHGVGRDAAHVAGLIASRGPGVGPRAPQAVGSARRRD